MSSRTLRPLGLVFALVIGLPVGVLLSWPQALGLQSAPIIAQLIAFRAPLALLLGGGAVVFSVVALVRRRWGIAAGLAIVLAAASLTNVFVLAGRGGNGWRLRAS